MTYFIRFILAISFAFVFIQCNEVNKTSNNTKISNIKKDSIKLSNEYIITYSNYEKEKLNIQCFIYLSYFSCSFFKLSFFVFV